MPSARDPIERIYAAVRELEQLYPGRPFTPDGHLVGSIGECLVAEAYDLRLMPPSNGGYDAVSACGKKVEIKATQGQRVAFRSEPEHCIVVQLSKSGTFRTIYDGPGHPIWSRFVGKKRPSNGQFQISLSTLARLQAELEPHQSLGQTLDSLAALAGSEPSPASIPSESLSDEGFGEPGSR
jgi:hypothetical protein